MTIEAMKQALELLESAHVATDLVWKRYDCITALRAAIEQAQEPVGYIHETGFFARNPNVSVTKGMKLYAAPRKWQGLTEKEAMEAVRVFRQENEGGFLVDFARAIEAKLREKNNG